MALRYAVASGNWSNTATWDGGTLPTAADTVFANSFTVTIDGTFTVVAITNIANTTPLIVAGGVFTFANGGDLTCTASSGVLNRNTGVATAFCLVFDLPTPNSATLRASVNNADIFSNGKNILAQNTGTFNMIGNYDIQTSAVGTNNRATIWVNGGTPTINIVGNLNSSFAGSNLTSILWVNGGNPTINITGNVSGGFSNSFTAGLGNAIYASLFSTINITGNITTNLTPSIYLNAGILNVTGNVTGGNSHPAIFGTATIDLLGLTTSGTNRAAVEGSVTTLVKIRGNVINTNTYSAIYAGRVTIDTSVISWQFKDSTNTITRTLYTVVGMPATSDVRFGTTFGGSGTLTGTLRVPSPSNVLSGVLTDNTTGTLLMTPADFWNYLISSGFTPNSIGDRLQNASTVATTGGQIASYNI